MFLLLLITGCGGAAKIDASVSTPGNSPRVGYFVSHDGWSVEYNASYWSADDFIAADGRQGFDLLHEPRELTEVDLSIIKWQPRMGDRDCINPAAASRSELSISRVLESGRFNGNTEWKLYARIDASLVDTTYEPFFIACRDLGDELTVYMTVRFYASDQPGSVLYEDWTDAKNEILAVLESIQRDASVQTPTGAEPSTSVMESWLGNNTSPS